MYTLNHTLEKNVIEADGRYLNAKEITALEQYAQGYATRLTAYQEVRDHSKQLVVQALTHLFKAYPDLLQSHKQRCVYDMSETLRYIALSILRDDEVFFMEALMSWLDTILLAYKKTGPCAIAYRHLQDAVEQHLSPNTASFVRPYLERVRQGLEAHA
jgi:hypothetical protein